MCIHEGDTIEIMLGSTVHQGTVLEISGKLVTILYEHGLLTWNTQDETVSSGDIAARQAA